MAQLTEYRSVLLAVFAISMLCLCGNAVLAEPYLQLDAYPAAYVGGEEESIVSTELDFTLYALVNSKKGPVGGSFYIAAALAPLDPVVPPDADLGSIYLDGVEISVVSGMEYGIPAKEDMPSHGTYPTYYYEHEFTLKLDPAKTTALYNSQDVDLDGPLSVVGGESLYFEDFEVDATGLAHGFMIHFDLYTKNADGTLADKAPFSHDVLAMPVPGAVLLGILGLGAAGMKLRKHA